MVKYDIALIELRENHLFKSSISLNQKENFYFRVEEIEGNIYSVKFIISHIIG